MPVRFETRLLAAFTAAVVCIVLLAGITWKVGVDATEATQWVSHTHEVLTSLARTRSDSIQIELSTQNFRLTGNPAQLAERDATIASREQLLRQLKEQTRDNPLQLVRWQELRQVIDERLAMSRHVEALRKTQGMEAASAYVATAPLQASRKRAYQLLADMEASERQLLGQRVAEQLETRQRVLLSGALLSALTTAMLLATFALIRRHTRDTALARQRLADSEEHLATTLHSIGDAVIATDAQGRVNRMNRMAEDLTGWPVAQAQGRPIEDVLRLVHEHTRAPAEVPVARVLAHGRPHDMERHTMLIARDGKEVPIADSAAPIRSAQGDVLGVVIVFRDDSVARHAEQLIRDQNRQLEQRVDERTAELQETQFHLRSVMNNVPAMIAYVDPQQRYAYANARYRMRFAPTSEDLTGRLVRDVLGEQRYAVAAPFIEKVLQGKPQSYDWEPFPGVWHAINYVPRHDAQNRIEGYYVLGMDITARRQAEDALRASQQQLARVLEGADQGYWEWNLQTDAFQVSPRWESMLGYAPGEMLVGTEHWPDLVHPDDLPATMELIRRHVAGETESHLAEIRCKTKDGQWKWIQSRGRIVTRTADGAPLLMSGTHTDISQLKAHEWELDHVAHYDPLTELPNRRLLTDRLQQSILRSDRSGKLSAVCFLDLDGFKLINDRHGLPVGDRLLVGVTEHLKTVLRADDTLARLGGDEFALILTDVTSPEECGLILDRVLHVVRQPVQIDEHQLSISASIGVSLYPADNADPDTLLRHADQAMYLAKQAGKNRYQMFDPEIDRLAQRHRERLIQLRAALDHQEFVLHYQPKVNLLDGSVIGAEALIRWQHPQRGLLPPREFLTHVSGKELEAAFGEWVIDTALAQMGTWTRLGQPLHVSVNISANHLLQPDFSDRLRQALDRHPDVPASHLELEVLETAAIGDMQQAVDILRRCMALGVTFSLDDFGTGYSSLTYLRKLPVQTLKIDQSFVRDMLTDPDDLGIVQGVIQLAEAFHRDVIAEGVETLEHGAALRQLGCHQVQGYGIARPMPAADLPDWCENWRREGLWKQL